MSKTPRAVPLDARLYEEVKAEMRRKYVWPSAYGSAALVREYKKRGGRYASRRANPPLNWHMRHDDVYEVLEGLLDRTGRVEDLLAMLADIYDAKSGTSKYEQVEGAMRDTSSVLKDASSLIESIWDLE